MHRLHTGYLTPILLIVLAVCRGQGVPDASQQQYTGPPPQKLLMDHAARQWQVRVQHTCVCHTAARQAHAFKRCACGSCRGSHLHPQLRLGVHTARFVCVIKYHTAQAVQQQCGHVVASLWRLLICCTCCCAVCLCPQAVLLYILDSESHFDLPITSVSGCRGFCRSPQGHGLIHGLHNAVLL